MPRLPRPQRDDFYVYPTQRPDAEQAGGRSLRMSLWSKTQTGFDPTQPGGGVPAARDGASREQYQRAMTACLEARGYSVK